MTYAALKLAPLFLVANLALAGCGSEKIEADMTYLMDAAQAGNNTWLTATFAPDASFKPRSLRIRVDGKWLLNSPGDPTFVTLQPEGNYLWRVDALVGAPHIFQLTEPDGDVLLTTSALQLTPGRNNQLVIYGGAGALAYHFFANSDAELASVPDGMVLARFVNLMGDHSPVPLRTCPASAGGLGALELAACTVVEESLAYGVVRQLWLPRATNLAVSCDPAAPDTVCALWNLAPTCVPDSGAPAIPARAAFFGLTQRGYGVFEGYDVWCPGALTTGR